jgi:predicted amino acid racemase
MLLRTPAFSQVDQVVQLAQISLNSELLVLKALSEAAVRQAQSHGVILMVELGDLREGIMPEQLSGMAKATLELQGIRLVGIGANLFCFGGVRPDMENMGLLSDLAADLEAELSHELRIVSGGGTINYSWAESAGDLGRINHLRCGEALLVGGATLDIQGIPGMRQDTFTLVAEIIESKVKPSKPWGRDIGANAFGGSGNFPDRGEMKRLIANVGLQDVLDPGDLRPKQEIAILGASSDHLIIDAGDSGVGMADEVAFFLGYNSMMMAMTSPFVEKVYLGQEMARMG